MTRRLYYEDWTLLDFTATVEASELRDGRRAVILDRTAFYPTGGGQPFDTGELDGRRVVDVQADEEGRVVHLLEGAAGPEPGRSVQGRVDRTRRQDHTQQHSAQHILSQAFVQTCGRETLSFHLGEETSSIDLDGLVSEQQAQAAEDLVNRVLWEDRPVRVHQVGPDEVSRFPVRKVTFTGPTVRLIEVQDFDVSTCGGTHVRRTGEVGLLLIRRLEKIRGGSRVVFAAGGRSLRLARQDRDLAQQVSQLLSTAPDRVLPQVRQLQEEHKALGRRVREQTTALAEWEAAALAGSAATGLVVRRLEQRTWDEVQALGQALSQRPDLTALLGLEAEGRILLVRGAAVDRHAGEHMKRALDGLSGGGGGGANRAQAQLPKEEWAVAFARLEQALGPPRS